LSVTLQKSSLLISAYGTNKRQISTLVVLTCDFKDRISIERADDVLAIITLAWEERSGYVVNNIRLKGKLSFEIT